MAGTIPKSDFSLDNYEEYYTGHFFGEYKDYLNADRGLTRVTWVKSEVPDGARVLDLGCLDGFTLLTLAHKKGVSGVGVDLSKYGIDLARERTEKHGFDLTFYNQAIEDLDLDEQFDVILCMEVIEHVKDVQKLYDVIDKHLKPDGFVLMDTPDYDTPMGRVNPDPLHIRYYTHKLEHEAPDAVSLPKEVGEDRVEYVEVWDDLIHIKYRK